MRKLVQIRREQRETVRGMAEQVGIDQHVGKIASDVRPAAGALGERACEAAQIRCGVTR